MRVWTGPGPTWSPYLSLEDRSTPVDSAVRVSMAFLRAFMMLGRVAYLARRKGCLGGWVGGEGGEGC